MSALPLMLLFLSAIALTFQSCKGKSKSNNLSAATDSLSDDALMDTVQRRTFLYFWEGAEPNSGLAPERYHVDGVYPENDANVVTSGGSGFGIMAILAGIDRLRHPRGGTGTNGTHRFFPRKGRPFPWSLPSLVVW